MNKKDDALMLALEAHKKNERHSTVAETRYWCGQYKLLAKQAIEALAEQPAQQQEIDWKDQYEKQKRRAEMWIAKYEADIGPLEKAGPVTAQQQEPVAWMHWLHGPVRLFLNKDEAQMELERLNRDYPVDAGSRKMRPLVFGDTSPPASKPWVGLTDGEKTELWNFQMPAPLSYADAIEAKLREKNA